MHAFGKPFFFSKTEKAKASEAKTRFSCITEAHESTRQGIESVTKRTHEEHIAERRAEFCIALQFRALIYSDAASDEDSRCKRQQWTRNGKKLETIPAWDVNKVKSKKEVTKEAQKNNNKLHFASLMDLCHLKNSELEPHFQKFKGKTCTSSRRCERRLWSLCSFMLNRAHQHHQ